MHAIYGAGIIGGVAIPLPAISEPVIFPSVAFPPPVILSPCARAGVIIDVPTAVKVNADDTIAAATTKNVASILPFMLEFIGGAKTTNYIKAAHILIS
jgi:hypothetical protein